jgi:hypothetical protein
VRWCVEFVEQRTSDLLDLVETSKLWAFKG